MRISELFYSIQGEGTLVGVPSVFVRTSGCNLRCGWCDTPYASWKPEGSERSVEEVLAEVEKHPARHVVLTGGEPMIAKELPELAGRLREAGYHLTIETAGTVMPAGIAGGIDALTATPHCLVLRAEDLPGRTTRGDTGTYGLTMSIWERLAAPHLAACMAGSAAVPAGQRIAALKRVIEIDPGCEVAHQMISRISGEAARTQIT
jgi:hypothetical protein